MIEKRTNTGGFRALIALASMGIFLLMTASCNSERVSQVEDKAVQAEKRVVELSTEFAQFKASAAADKRLLDELHGKIKAAEERAKADPAIAAIAKIEKVMDVTPQGVVTKPATAVASVDASKSDAIRIHSLAVLAGESQIAKEYTELLPALQACDKENKMTLNLCVKPKQSPYSAWLPVLITWKKDAISSPAEAKALLGCLQNQPVVKANGNAAELVLLSGFTGDCLPKPAE